MSRTVPYDREAICDLCGVRGAYDFMGGLICAACSSNAIAGADVFGDVTTVETGVVAELDGKYYGIQYADGHSTEFGFGPVEKAMVSDPKYCHKPTDMTYKGSYIEEELAKATLRSIRITRIYAVGA